MRTRTKGTNVKSGKGEKEETDNTLSCHLVETRKNIARQSKLGLIHMPEGLCGSRIAHTMSGEYI
jgi:hypothetical protein